MLAPPVCVHRECSADYRGAFVRINRPTEIHIHGAHWVPYFRKLEIILLDLFDYTFFCGGFIIVGGSVCKHWHCFIFVDLLENGLYFILYSPVKSLDFIENVCVLS